DFRTDLSDRCNRSGAGEGASKCLPLDHASDRNLAKPTKPMTAPAPPRRRWFRYSLRTFFVLLTIFGVWLGVQVKWMRDRQQAVEHYSTRGVVLFWPALPANIQKAPWPIRLLGEKAAISRMAFLRGVTDGECNRLQRLFPEAWVKDLREFSDYDRQVARLRR